MKKLTDLPPEERPRERLLDKGAPALADYELLAILLREGTHKHDVFSISRRLVKIIDRKGINLLDHVIFNREEYYSFMENDAL